jgi:hypothetical protein
VVSADSLMADSLVLVLASAWVLVTDAEWAHALVDVFVVLLARSVDCSQAADVLLKHHLADVQLQQLLLAVADATS